MTKDSDFIEFGRPLREKYFSHVNPEAYLINNGAFGLAPLPILESLQRHTLRDYYWPDAYRKFEYRDDYDDSAKEVAKVLNTDYRNIALGLNVTTLINAVLRSFKFEKGDKILVQSNTYPAILKTVNFVAKQNELEVVKFDLNYPLSDDEVVSKYEDELSTNKIKIVLIDTISSKPGVRVPFERLVKLAKEHDALSLVDAAHGIGLLDIDLGELKPDFLATDLYKWYYTPKNSAALYVDPKHHKAVHSLPISHFYVDGDQVLKEEKEQTRFADQFNFIGAQITASLVTVKDASKFIEEIGGLQRVKDYNFRLAREASEAVAKLWGTVILENDEKSLLTSLFTVEYPVKEGVLIREEDWENLEKYMLIRQTIEKKLIKEYKSVAPIFLHNGKIWIRFSAQIYSELNDYIEGAKLLEKGVDEFFASEEYKKLIAD